MLVDFKGIINIRGKVHVIFNLRVKFTLDDKRVDESKKIIVINEKDIGFIVDECNPALKMAE